MARWRCDNPEANAKIVSEYRVKNAERISEYLKGWYQSNKELCNQRSVEWRKNNHARYLENASKNRQSNPKKYREYCKNWARKYPDKVVAKTVMREASKIKATPRWLSFEQISEIDDMYKMAKMIQTYTGAEYHVDHIVPLRGKTVCGLHVPWNLQLLPWNENLSKQNRHWPDMPE